MKNAIKMFCASVAVASISLGAVQVMAANESSSNQTTAKTIATNTASAATPATKHVVKLIGNSETKKFHKPSCEWVKKMSKENRVEFASSADARKAGYEPCKVCLPVKPVKKAASAATSATAPAAKTQ